jgi:hypothetical protein
MSFEKDVKDVTKNDVSKEAQTARRAAKALDDALAEIQRLKTRIANLEAKLTTLGS